jgi:uncharacterized Zn-binding protein involved in type VI secretion
MGKPAARIGDMTVHGGSITTGSINVYIGNANAARILDMHSCPMQTPGTPPVPHVGGPIIEGCPTVLINGRAIARQGHMASCAGPPDEIKTGFPTVLIDEVNTVLAGEEAEEIQEVVQEIAELDAQINDLERRAEQRRQLARDAESQTGQPETMGLDPLDGSRDEWTWREWAIFIAGSTFDPVDSREAAGGEMARDDFNREADEFDGQAQELRGRRDVLRTRLNI